MDAKVYGKDITEEVDTLVRNGEKASGPHCDALLMKADVVAKQDKTASAFKPSISSTPLEIYVTVNLKAKTLKRLLAKLAILAGIHTILSRCQRTIPTETLRSLKQMINLCSYMETALF
jgi:hypothetical protein